MVSWCWDDKNNSFPPIRTLTLIGACIFYFGDIVLDSIAASEHYQAWREGNENALSYFVSSVVFIAFPSLTVNILSLVLYTWGYCVYRNKELRARYSNTNEGYTHVAPIAWHKNKTEDATRQLQSSRPHYRETSLSENGIDEIDFPPQFYALDSLFTYEYIIVFVLHLFQIGFLFRALRLIYRRRIDHYSFDRYRDISFLRLMESFLESAPQLFLQLYIVVLEDIPDVSRKVWTWITVIFSMVSLAFAVADYISAGKDVLYYDPPPNRVRKPRLSWPAYIIIILWQFAMIVSRALAVALFASEYGYYTFIIAGTHYLVMLYWMYRQKPSLVKKDLTDYDGPRLDRREKLCANYGLEFLAAAFNLFFLFKLVAEDSLLYTTAYYTLFFIENVLMIGLWYVHVDYTLNLWYLQASVVAVVMSFFIGLGIMMLYYLYFHPKDREDLPKDPNHRHPVMTCTLNSLYRDDTKTVNKSTESAKPSSSMLIMIQ